MAPGSWSTEMVDVLERQLSLVTDLGSLAEEQAALVRDEKTEALLSLLARRQQVVDALTETQTEVVRLSDDSSVDPSSLPEATRSRLRTLVDGISEQLSAVMRQDASDQAVLSDRRDSTRTDIQQVGTARVAQRAYIGTPPPAPRFSDRKG